MKRSRAPWTKGEKAILTSIIVVVAIVLAAIGWNAYENADPIVHIPKVSMPAPNGFDYARSASEGIVQQWPMPGYLPHSAKFAPSSSPKPNLKDPAVLTAARSLLKSEEANFNTLRAGYAYPFRCPPVRSAKHLALYLGNLRGLARALAFQAAVDDAAGDTDSSLTAALDTIRLGNKVPRGGGNYHSSCGAAIEAIGRRPLWNIAGRLTSRQCRRVASTLESVDNMAVPISDTFREEELSNEALMSEAFHDQDWRDYVERTARDSAELSDSKPDDGAIHRAALTTSKRGLMADYIARMDAIIAAAAKPYSTQLTTFHASPIVDAMTLDCDMVRFQSTRQSAENRLLVTTCALRGYKLDHHAYPSTLSQLVPAYLHSVPLDPFAASSTLAYRRTHETYVLYSIGPDCRDDNGVAVYDSTQTATQAHRVDVDSKGDIVAGLNL